MANIIKEILKHLPDNKISQAVFEGANIVLYTKDEDFFLNGEDQIKSIVNQIKKRIELRPDPSICLDMEKAKPMIKKLVDKDAELETIIFDPQRSRVIIEVSKPGLAIGKHGSNLKEIKKKTMWVPIIRRRPAIRSQLIEDIRQVLYLNNDYRRKFLDRIGHRIYDGWIREKKKEWIRLTFLGGGRQVGRSCILLQTPESRILLDCGIDVAANSNDQAYPHLECPEFRIDELDAVIVTHSHLDHCGFIPYLYKFGYKGPVYCTAPTRDVMALLLLDFVKIQKMQGKEPIYTSDDIKEMVKHTICLDYKEVSDITPDVRITLFNAGHILGSSIIHIHIGNGLHNLVYTGDMKFLRTKLLEPAVPRFQRVETMIIESTYGGKTNTLPSRRDEEEKLAQLVGKTLEQGGKSLIPVLGSGRAQELMLIIQSLMKRGKIPKVPVYIDGMVWDITAIHTAYPEFLNSKVRKQIFHKNANPFLSDIFKRVGSNKERKTIIEDEGPCVILATSGMLVGGASVEYLRKLGDNPKNSMVFVSYQGEGSLGRRIQRGEREINFGSAVRSNIVPLKLKVETIEGFTGHAGRRELMNYIYRNNPKPRKIIINHGETSRCIDLASSLHKRYRLETITPRNLEAVRLK